jgi:hypothetical protein
VAVRLRADHRDDRLVDRHRVRSPRAARALLLRPPVQLESNGGQPSMVSRRTSSPPRVRPPSTDGPCLRRSLSEPPTNELLEQALSIPALLTPTQCHQRARSQPNGMEMPVPPRRLAPLLRVGPKAVLNISL